MREIAYRLASLRDVKRLKRKHYDMNALKSALRAVASRDTDGLRQHGDHQLVGSLRNCRELHIQADWFLLYTFDGDALTIVRTGSHDDLF